MRRLFIVLAITLLMSGCASGLKRPVTSIEAVTDASGVQRVAVDLHSFYIKPSRIVVHAGRPVELTVRNRAVLVPHNFSVPDPSIAVEVNKWGLGAHKVTFTPKVVGEYQFFCDVDSHAKKGMRGVLVVVP